MRIIRNIFAVFILVAVSFVASLGYRALVSSIFAFLLPNMLEYRERWEHTFEESSFGEAESIYYGIMKAHLRLCI